MIGKKIKIPSVSIIIATFNSERTIGFCLERISSQDYDKKKVEIVIADGGSKDKTLIIAKKYGGRIIKVDPKKQNAEYNKGIGLKNAKNEIVLFLDHDNIMPHSNWLKKMISPLASDLKIIGVEPLRFHYDSSMTLLDRYIALFGGSDPVVYYLGKNSHLSWKDDEYNLLGESKDMDWYYHVIFSPYKIPALGGNGAAFRRNDLHRFVKADPEHFLHTDVVSDLIVGGHNNYAIIKDTIMHLTNNKVIPFLQRRKYFIEKYYMETQGKRRYKIYDPRTDKLQLVKYIILSTTFIIPFWDALKGYLKIKDIAWFLHPFMCFSFLVIYSLPVFKGGVRHVLLGK